MRWLTWPFLDRHRDVFLLVGRVGLGLMMMAHGWPKVIHPEKWEGLGGAMANLGITFMPSVWGGAAAITELVGGLLVVLGLATRPAALLVAFTLFVAFFMHFSAGDGFRGWSHAAETGIGFLMIAGLGGGRYAVDRLLKR